MRNDATTDYQFVTLTRQGLIATLTMHRPERANALSHAHLAELEHAALSLRDDPVTRVIIITGAGKHFSSADLTGHAFLCHALSATSQQSAHG